VRGLGFKSYVCHYELFKWAELGERRKAILWSKEEARIFMFSKGNQVRGAEPCWSLLFCLNVWITTCMCMIPLGFPEIALRTVYSRQVTHDVFGVFYVPKMELPGGPHLPARRYLWFNPILSFSDARPGGSNWPARRREHFGSIF